MIDQTRRGSHPGASLQDQYQPFTLDGSISMTIKQLDAQTLKVVRAKMDEALAVLEEIGIHGETAHISYQDQNATVKVEISVLGDGGEVVSKEAVDYDRYRELHDLPERGTTFTHRGDTYTITGFKPRSRKYPVIATRVLRNGTGIQAYKFSVDAVVPERPSVRAMRLAEEHMDALKEQEGQEGNE